jgi:transposase
MLGRRSDGDHDEEDVVLRRLVGIDLGIASAHTVRVPDEGGREVFRRRCEPTVVSLTAIETAALAGAVAGTRLEVVFEPTGPAWLPIAVFFTARGHAVFRVSSAKAADLLRFRSRHAKSNGIDADTLAVGVRANVPNRVRPNMHRSITTLNDRSRRSAILPSIWPSTSATLGCPSRAKIVITEGDCFGA